MIRGAVNAASEAVISLELFGPNAQSLSFPAVIDTGFDGDIALPVSEIHALGLPPAGYVEAVLGDGSEVELTMYAATLRWNNEHRQAQVLETAGAALVGTKLLQSFELQIHFVNDGDVLIKPLDPAA